MMAMNLALPLEHFEGHRPSHCKRKVYPLAWRIVSYQSNSSAWGKWPSVCIARGTFLVAAAMVMEFVVDCWPLVAWCLHQDKPHSRNSRSLPLQQFFVLNILGWSKFYLRCPATPHRIHFIL
jgi:hypothetical protein